VNTAYSDRFVTIRGEITGSGKKDNDSLKISAAQFNSTISDFYSKINPSQTSVAHATNYYIEKMSLIKNEDYATRAAAMIPVSVNFTTDGISGLGMGQAFTVPDQLLPYTYTTRKIPGAPQDYINNVGFVMVGLTHTIENNQWNTAVRANMIYLKDKTAFSGSVVKVDGATGVFGVNTSGAEVPIIGNITRKRINKGAALSEPGFLQKLEQVAKNIGANVEDLKAVMNAESGLDPAAVNPDGGASGLIQFMPQTAIALGTTVEKIRTMTAVQQLDLVENFYRNAGKNATSSVYGLYAFTFLPAMVKQLSNDSFILEFKGLPATLISSKNPGIARAAGKSPGTPLTVGDFKLYVNSIL
jgi:hypothetical protein